MPDITNVRIWGKTRGALQLQPAYQSPVAAFTNGLWFEKIMLHENPMKTEYQGLNANNFSNTLARTILRFEPFIEVFGRATPKALLELLPAASGKVFAGDVLQFSPASKYLSVAFQDNLDFVAGSQLWRFEDCLMTRLLLQSELPGELMYHAFLMPEITTKQFLDVATITIPDEPTIDDSMNHRSGIPLTFDPLGANTPLGCGLFSLEIVNRIKPHHGPALNPLNIKTGYTRARGEIRARYGDEYRIVRENALIVSYKELVWRWFTAGATKFLNIDLKRVDLDAPAVEVVDQTVPPFLAEYETFSDGLDDPIVITKGGF